MPTALHRLTPLLLLHSSQTTSLVEWVGAGAPVCKEHAQADGLEDASQDANGNGVERSLFGDDLREDLQGSISIIFS